MAVAAGIVAAVVAIGVAVKNGQARKEAAKDLQNANIKSANILASAGRDAEAGLLLAQNEAITALNLGAEEAEGRISPFATGGAEAFQQAQSQIISGADVSGPLADSIRSASLSGASPAFFDTSGPVANEIQRQADLSVSGVTPEFNRALLQQGRLGVSATGDVAGIRSRALSRAGTLAGAGGAQRATVLVGQTPALAELATGAQEARLLGDIQSRQFNTQAAEELAKLAGGFS